MHACMHACVCMDEWISSNLWVKRNKFELTCREDFHFSDKFDSIVEKGTKYELVQHESSHYSDQFNSIVEYG